MKNLLLLSTLSLSLSAFGQVKNVQKNPGTNELTESFATGNRTLTISEDGGLTVENDALVSGLIQPGDNVSSLANDAGYLTSVTWSDITSKPTTLAGFGITDGVATSRLISAGTGLAGGGDLSTNRTLSLSAGSIASLALADSAVQPAALAGYQPVSGISPAGYVARFTSGTATQDILISPPDEDSGNFAVSVPQYANGYFGIVQDDQGRVNLASGEVFGLLADGNIASAATWNAKQAAITGAATTITSSNLTASRALVSDGSGKVAVSTVTSTELGYLSGVTSALQTQINSKIGGSTGATDNAVLLADGAGGSTAKAANGVTQTNAQFLDFRANTALSEYMGFQFFRDGVDAGGMQSAFGFMQLRASSAFTFATSGTERMGISSSGNIGMGAVTYNSPVQLGVLGAAHFYDAFSGGTNYSGVGIIPGGSRNDIIPVVGGGGGTAKPIRYYYTLSVWDGAGSGSPEGVETAGIGSTYRDTSTGSLYRKTSGSGNTGWVTP